LLRAGREEDSGGNPREADDGYGTWSGKYVVDVLVRADLPCTRVDGPRRPRRLLAGGAVFDIATG